MYGRATGPPWLILADRIKEVVHNCQDVRLTKTALTTSIIILGLRENCGNDISITINLTDETIEFINRWDVYTVENEGGKSDLATVTTNKVSIAQPDSVDKMIEWLRKAKVTLREDKVAELLK